MKINKSYLLIILGTVLCASFFEPKIASFKAVEAKKTITDAVRKEIIELNKPVSNPGSTYSGTYYNEITSSVLSSPSALFNKLTSIISSNTHSVGYDGLYSLYESSDSRPDGTIWDMYGDFAFEKGEKAGNYKSEGDCYNREHSVPQSWWGSDSTKKADAFHVVPTDAKINGLRGNYPFGEVGTATYTYDLSSNPSIHYLSSGLNKVGNSSFSGYTGKVFEPMDCYKGDFARNSLYFATRYPGAATQSEGDVTFSSNSSNFYLTTYGKNLLMKWHKQDPVSQKEIIRNDAIYLKQNNRNPFIDHPEYADIIWGDGPVDPIKPTSITMSISPNSIYVGDTVNATLSFTPNNAEKTVSWSSIDSTIAEVDSTGKITGLKAGTTNIKAVSTLDSSVFATSTITIKAPASCINLVASGTPTKTVYEEGQAFDPAGLTITAEFDDGTTSDVTSQVEWSPTTLKIDTSFVVGTYKNKTVQISGITVKKAETKSFKIDIKNSSADGSSVLTNDAAKDLITESADQIKTLEVENIYAGVTGFKMSSSSKSGSIDIVLNKTMNVTDIKVEAAKYKTDSATLSITTDAPKGTATISPTDSLTAFSTKISGQVSTISLVSSKRSYLKSITFVTSSGEEKTLTSLNYEGQPLKTLYYDGDYFDPSGLTITATFSDGSTSNVNENVLWTPSPLTIGTNSVVGKYTYNEISKEITITGIVVSKNIIKVQGISINPNSIKLSLKNNKATISVSVTPSTATDKTYTSSFSDASVASYDDTTKTITALKLGETTLTLTANDGSGTQGVCNIVVQNDAVMVTDIIVNPGTVNLDLKDSKTQILSVKVLPENANNKEYDFSISDNSIISFSKENMTITALSKGTSIITFTSKDGSNVKGICTVNVQEKAEPIIKVEKIEMLGSIDSIYVGNTFKFSYDISPNNSTNKNVIWSTSDESIATVSNDGLVKGIKSGTVTITVCSAENSSIKDSKTIKIISKTSQGCGGSIIVGASSTVLFSLIGVALIILKKRGNKNETENE